MKKKSIVAGVCLLLFFLLILLVKTVDVAAIGPCGTSIGLSHLNGAVHGFTGVNFLWYDVTDVFVLFAVLVGVVYVIAGLVQLIRRKNLWKVDREILTLGILFAVLIALYGLFERVVINYRPVLMPGDTAPAASFPSSHTMLLCVVMGGAILLMDRYVKKPSLCRILQILCGVLMAITVVGRLISGVHWFTDILGGLLLSAALLLLFSSAIQKKT